MISIEIMAVIAFTLIASAMYTIYRYFDDHIKCIDNKIGDLQRYLKDLNLIHSDMIGNNQKKIELLEQKLKDGLQSNAICCKSSIEPIKRELERLKYLYEKQNHGSIKVVRPEIKQERKPAIPKVKQ